MQELVLVFLLFYRRRLFNSLVYARYYLALDMTKVMVMIESYVYVHQMLTN